MKKMITRGMGLAVMAAVLFSFNLPSGWFAAGNNPKGYDMGIDPGAGPDGGNAATIRSNANVTAEGFGTLMQESLPGKFLGKRVRMTGWMKTKDVTDWAGLWLRVDGKKTSLSFDNMQKRAIKGTTSWKKYEIVLDVPTEAVQLAYGALLSGAGQIWFRDLEFEVVDASVPVTGSSVMDYTQDEPTNLDFSKVEGKSSVVGVSEGATFR